MKEFTLYLVYIVLIIAITSYFSLLIIERHISRSMISKNEKYESPTQQFTICIEKSKNPLLVYSLKSNCNIISDGTFIKLEKPYRVKINSFGLRDYEYSVEKPNNTFRIIILGDSFTFGEGVKLEESYPKVLETMLNSNSKLSYQVLNFGVGGYGMVQKVELFKAKGIMFNPDMVVVQSADDDIILSYVDVITFFKGQKYFKI